MNPDLIIVGCGPAGLQAAHVAADGGLNVLVLDEQMKPGGQIYRNVERAAGREWLGADYAKGLSLVGHLKHSGITYIAGAVVWRIDDGRRVIWSVNGRAETATAPHVLIATGAQERPCPFPGWTLPGVMPAGSAQILMKQSALLPKDAVLAGSGPLLYLIAAQMIAAGAPPGALVETNDTRSLVRALPQLAGALRDLPTLIKGVKLLRQIRGAGIARFRGASAFRAVTEGEGISFSFTSGGQRHTIECGLLLTHLGVAPSTHLSRATGLRHVYEDRQKAWRPDVDRWGFSSKQGILVAGDGAGIDGADAARLRGSVAALAVLEASGLITAPERDRRAAPIFKALRKSLAARPFLDAAYPVPKGFATPVDETVVCRCEEVTAGQVRAAAASGAAGMRAMRTTLRTGMGPCQGRMCEPTVAALVAEATGQRVQDVGPARIRTPVKPVTLGEIAEIGAERISR